MKRLISITAWTVLLVAANAVHAQSGTLSNTILDVPNEGLKLRDADGSNTLKLKWNENDTADREINLKIEGGSKVFTLSGNSALNQNLLTTSSPTFAGATMTGQVALPAATYDEAAWNGSLLAVTRDVVRDLHEALAARIDGVEDAIDPSAPAAGLVYSADDLTTAAANRTTLNSRFAANLPTVTEGKPLFVTGGAVDLGERTGTVFTTAGGYEPIWHAESEYGTSPSHHGGPVGRLIWVGADKSGPLLRTGGYGNRIKLALQGAYHATNLASLTSAYPKVLDEACNADHTGDARKETGLQVDSVNGFGTGKHDLQIAPMFFQTGIKVTDSVFMGHGDQCAVYPRFTAFFCDIGFHCQQEQAYSWQFGECELGNVACGFRFSKGGKATFHELSLGTKCQYGLFIDGNDTETRAFDFVIQRLNIDQSAPRRGVNGWTNASAQGVVVRPSTGNAAVRVRVMGGDIPFERALMAEPDPLFSVKNCYGSMQIYGLDDLYDGMILHQGGSSTHRMKYIIGGCGFWVGKHDAANAWKIFAPGSSGPVALKFRDNFEQAGATGDDGTFYEDTVLHGTLSTNDNGTPGDTTDDFVEFEEF